MINKKLINLVLRHNQTIKINNKLIDILQQTYRKIPDIFFGDTFRKLTQIDSSLFQTNKNINKTSVVLSQSKRNIIGLISNKIQNNRSIVKLNYIGSQIKRNIIELSESTKQTYRRINNIFVFSIQTNRKINKR